MKRLRILTGVHAGASIVLGEGQVRIGNHAQADIHITDWTEADVILIVAQASAVMMQVVEAHEDQEQEQEHDGDAWPAPASMPEHSMPAAARTDVAPPTAPTLDMSFSAAPTNTIADFTPQRHGEVVFCVGPDDLQWPADVELLKQLYADSHASETGALWRTPALIGVGALACAMAMICALLLMSETGHAVAVLDPKHAHSTARLAQKLQDELTQRGLQDIEIQPQGDALQLEGYVPTIAADAQLRDFVRGLGDERIKRHYRIARNDEQSLQQLLNQPGVRVDYGGKRVFRVSGAVPSMAEYEKALARARIELGTPSVQITSEVKETPAQAPSVAYANLFSTGELSYARTPDGTKHVFPTPSSLLPIIEQNDVNAPIVRVLSLNADIAPEPKISTTVPRRAPRKRTQTKQVQAARTTTEVTRSRANSADFVPPRPPLKADGVFVGLPPMPSGN